MIRWNTWGAEVNFWARGIRGLDECIFRATPPNNECSNNYYKVSNPVKLLFVM